MKTDGLSIEVLALSADAHHVLCGSKRGVLGLWELDWDYQFPEDADWDEGAEPYLEAFLTLRCHVSKDSWGRFGKPMWAEEDFQALLTELQNHGYGWLRPEGVHQMLERLTCEWKDPPSYRGRKAMIRHLQEMQPEDLSSQTTSPGEREQS